MKTLRVTEVLAIAGATDYSFATDDAKFRGSETHRAVQLASVGNLKIRSIPKSIEGYMDGFYKFKRECRYVVVEAERTVESKPLGLRGRLDARGFLRGEPALFDFKTGAIQPAVTLQLCLYGHMLPLPSWWARFGVQLTSDGDYKLKPYPMMTWGADLATALAMVRAARWRMANGLVRA